MKKTTPRVSIVVPAYNRERFLGRTIDSVLAQTEARWELVVSDDGSTDETAAIAERYAISDQRITTLTSPNGGVAHARNRGLDATDAGSEFVVFLDSDDRWFPDTLSTMISALGARPDWVSVYGTARCIDPNDALIPGDDLQERMRERVEYRGRQLVEVGSAEPTTFAAMVHHNYPATPGLHLIRRSVLDRVGGFDPATDPADDWDMAIRLTREGDIGFIDHLVLEWRRHDDTLTATSPRWRQAYYRVLSKTLIAGANTREQRRLVRRAYIDISRNTLRQAKTDALGRDARRATRNVARSADALIQYLLADRRRLVCHLRTGSRDRG